jgi:hypothetical protein
LGSAAPLRWRRPEGFSTIRRPNSAFSGTVRGDLVEWFGIATDRAYQVDVR